MGRRAALTSEQDADTLHRWRSGTTLRSLAKEYGVSEHAIGRARDRALAIEEIQTARNGRYKAISQLDRIEYMLIALTRHFGVD